VNLTPRLEKVFINQVGRVKRLEPFLGVVNFYTDLSAMDQISCWKIRALAFRILFSPVNFHFTGTGISTLTLYAGKSMKANWAFMIAIPGPGDKERGSPVNIDIAYADDWVFPNGSLKGKVAQVSSTYGRGRVILTGLHAELRRKTYDIVIRNILWLANLEEGVSPSTIA